MVYVIRCDDQLEQQQPTPPQPPQPPSSSDHTRTKNQRAVNPLIGETSASYE